LVLFIGASVVAMLFMKQMLGWFMFINSAMIIFLLPLSFFRFFWWRFNVWGELSAIILGLPLSVLIWFGLDFQDTAKHPMWQGLSILLGLSFLVLISVTLLTPAESQATLARFYDRCRPPGLWAPIRVRAGLAAASPFLVGRLLVNSVLGIAACLGLVLATNALFVGDWPRLAGGLMGFVLMGIWLVCRMFQTQEEGPVSQNHPDADKSNTQ
jgi:SSS family solute:Na+ symporter